jgi:tetratricopeptide (TPR) repeat protein
LHFVKEVQVFAAMRESLALLRDQRFCEVVERCAPVLDANPNYVPLRLLMAQALVALERDLEAEAQLRFCLELDLECGEAYRYLGELELRRGRPKAATRLLEEACRLCPGDREARDLLIVVERRLRRAIEAPVYVPAGPGPKAPLALGTDSPPPRRGRPPAARFDPEAGKRQLARGTETPPPPRRHATLRDDFGDYLADAGILSRAQVRAALIYRRTRGVELGDAAIALGYVSEPKLRWALHAYQAAQRDDD